jgi:hypothetical protein
MIYHCMRALLNRTHLVKILDHQKLNVVNKTRSNIFSSRGQFTPEFVLCLPDAAA